MSANTQLVCEMLEAMVRLSDEVSTLGFGPHAAAVYNPLVYARAGAEAYIRRYARHCRALLIGMNPGPFGMAQTGVPFGEIAAVRDWLGIAAEIGQPEVVHPKRPITGFACTRSEVSGRRLWGFFREVYGNPDGFFDHFHVANYCPLVFMEATGRNLTPDKLPVGERTPLYTACNRHLSRIATILEPEWIIGLGAFATKRSQEVLGTGYRYLTLPHPSPASPLANRGWNQLARQALAPLGFVPGC
ncbi:MAG TPA: single-stranded DNA-binding protein [Spirochaetota bacterium]|nr:single-stranded DNA-binding protein [Spirochaetota bacterium]HPH02219.1 single-stranded DNA-binding protein [Spirochaetota bacterium]